MNLIPASVEHQGRDLAESCKILCSFPLREMTNESLHWPKPSQSEMTSGPYGGPTQILHFYKVFFASCSSLFSFPSAPTIFSFVSRLNCFCQVSKICQEHQRDWSKRLSRWYFLHGWLCQSLSISFRNFNQSHSTPAVLAETTDEQRERRMIK